MKYWKRIDEHGDIRTVESYTHGNEVEGAQEITEGDFDDYIASLNPIDLPVPRDPIKEIDAIKIILAKHNIT